MTAELRDNEPADMDVILPEGGLVLIAGVKARVNRLKTREFLGLMRVIVNGVGPGLRDVDLSTSDQEEMKANLTSLMLLAMPNAAEEFVDFLRTVVAPESETDRAALAVAMQNPDPLDMIDVIGVVIDQEVVDLSALAGKAQAWLAKIKRTMEATRRG